MGDVPPKFNGDLLQGLTTILWFDSDISRIRVEDHGRECVRLTGENDFFQNAALRYDTKSIFHKIKKKNGII